MEQHSEVVRRSTLVLPGWTRRWGSFLLLFPASFVFAVFFVIPLAVLLALAFNPPVMGHIRVSSSITLANFARFFGDSLYTGAMLQTLQLGIVTALITLLLGYPLAYVVARTTNAARNTLYMILIMLPLQLDTVIRTYGLMILLGDNGLINGSLINYGLIKSPLPLMYNSFGIVLALVQFSLPFMALTLIASLRQVNPALEEAARNLGASQWRTFWKVTFPLTIPGVVAGCLLVFALSISAYVVPVLMGGWSTLVLPILIYQQIAELGNWQFGAAIALVLFAMSLAAVYIYHKASQRFLQGVN